MQKKVTREEFDQAMIIVTSYRNQLREEMNYVNSKLEIDETSYPISKDTMFHDSPASVRLKNVISAGSHKIPAIHGYPIKMSSFENVSIKDLMLFRNFGVKTRDELINLCAKAGVKLKP